MSYVICPQSLHEKPHEHQTKDRVQQLPTTTVHQPITNDHNFTWKKGENFPNPELKKFNS